MFVALVQANKRHCHFSLWTTQRNINFFFCYNRKFAVFVFCSVFRHQRKNRTQANDTRNNGWQIQRFGSLFPLQYFQPEASGDRHGRPRRISCQICPKRTHILSIPSKPHSFHSVHSAIGSRMNGMIFRSFRSFRSFRKRN